MLRLVARHDDDCAPNTRETNFALCCRYTPPGGRILDCGAGKGQLSRMLTQAGFRVHAIDRAIMDGPDFSDVERIEADLDQPLPLEDESVDTVVFQEVMHQLENPWAVFRETERVLRPRGTLIVSTPNVNHIFVRLHELVRHTTPHFLERHYRRGHQITPLPLWNLERMAEQAGFEITDVTYNMDYIPMLRLRLPGRSSPRLGHTLIVAMCRVSGASSPGPLEIEPYAVKLGP